MKINIFPSLAASALAFCMAITVQADQFEDVLCVKNAGINLKPKITYAFGSPYLGSRQIYKPITPSDVRYCQTRAVDSTEQVAMVERGVFKDEIQLFLVSVKTGKVTALLGGSKKTFTVNNPTPSESSDGGFTTINGEIRLKKVRFVQENGLEKFRV